MAILQIDPDLVEWSRISFKLLEFIFYYFFLFKSRKYSKVMTKIRFFFFFKNIQNTLIKVDLNSMKWSFSNHYSQDNAEDII